MGQLYTVGPSSPVQVPLDAYATSATVENLGPDTVYYRAGTTVSVAVNDGTLASGATLTITTATAFLAQTSSTRLYESDVVPTTGGGGGGSPTGVAGGDLTNNYPNPTVRTLTGGALGTATNQAAQGNLAEYQVNKGQASGYAPLDVSSLVPAVNSRVQSVAGRIGAVTLGEGDVANLTADLGATEKTANKGTANGYASLDGTTHLPRAQVPTLSVVTKTAAYTLTSGDDVVLADATTAAFTLTLPSAGTPRATPYMIRAVNTNANGVTLATTSSQLISGASTLLVGPTASGASYVAVSLVPDGTNWQLV